MVVKCIYVRIASLNIQIAVVEASSLTATKQATCLLK